MQELFSEYLLKDKSFLLKLTEKEHAWLKNEAKAQNKTVANLIRMALANLRNGADK
jgi:hypothetical protein